MSHGIPEHDGRPIMWREATWSSYGPLMIRVGNGYSIRAALLALVDPVAWIMSACPTADTLRSIADSIDVGRDVPETSPFEKPQEVTER